MSYVQILAVILLYISPLTFSAPRENNATPVGCPQGFCTNQSHLCCANNCFAGCFVSGPPFATFDAVPRFTDESCSSALDFVTRAPITVTGKFIKNSLVLIDDLGNVTLNGITKNGITINWPSTIGAAGTFLESDGTGNLIYAFPPSGGGNVSTALPFTGNDLLVRTDTVSGATNVQESGVTLDNSNNLSGINTLTATTIIGTVSNATNAVNFTGPLVGDVTGTQGGTIVSFVDTVPANLIASGATAANAATSANLASTIVKRDGSGNFSAGTITAALNGNATTATNAITATTAINFSGPLAGDVTGTQGGTIVSFVDTVPANLIASGATAANAATSTNIAGTIVKRDGSNNFSAGTITAALNGNAATATTATSAGSATTAISFTGPLLGDVTGTQGGTIVSFVDTVPANLIASGATAANAATSANIASTIVERDPSHNFSAGTITAALNGNAATATTATSAGSATTAISFTGPLLGDVTGTQGGTIVSFVDTVPANLIASGATAANAATSANIASTIVERDPSHNFSAGTITANLIGSASNNVLKAGDSMSGNLTMLDQAAIDFQDSGSNFVGIQAPTAVTSSYTLALPTTSPTAHQILRANITTPTNLEWVTDGGSVLPANSQTIYVAKYGNDTTGDGSFTAPYLTLSKAIGIANPIALTTPPVAILVGTGTYVENNSSGPLAITSGGISIIGESPTATIIMPNTPGNTLLSSNQTVLINRVTFQSTAPSATGVSLTFGNLSNFNSVRFVNFQTGVACSGSTSSYSFISCLFLANGTGLSLNNTTAECSDCTIAGTNSLIGPPANTGVSMTGSGANFVITGGACGLCSTGFALSNSAVLTASSVIFKRNAFPIVESSFAQMTLTGCTFQVTSGSSNINVQVNSATAEIIGCEFNGANTSGVAQGTGIVATNGALVDISGGGMQDFITGIQIGAPTDVASTIVTMSAFVIRDSTTDDLFQQGSATLNVNASTISSSKISIHDPTNVTLAYFDLDNNNALTIGSTANMNTPLIFAAISTVDTPSIDYQSSLYNTQAIGFINPSINPSTWFVASNNSADLTAITTDRTQIAGVRLVSDTHSPVGTTAALRGWDINKNASSAELSFNYQNSDTSGQTAFSEYTVMQLSGVANQLQLPTSGTQIVFGGDTNLFRTSADVLATTSNFIVAPLTPGRVVITDPVTNELSSSVTTSTELSYLSGTTSSIQTQINSKVAKAGDTMTGTLQLPAGSTALPSLTFTGSPGVGLSASSGNLALSTNATPRLTISSGGTIAIPQFTVPGVLHIVDSSGDVGNSLIVDADISATAAISDSKLATITTAGKVANSATTATSTNTPSAIVARDTSGNFSAGTITAALVGTVTGGASLDLPLTGGTLTGTLVLPAGLTTSPSLKFPGGNTGISSPVANTLSFDTNGAEQMNISATGAVTIDQLGSGVVHAVSGLLSASLIVDADIAEATITNDKLADISSNNIPGDIVVRDSVGDFITDMITITGTVSDPTDVATKAYVDAAISTGLVAKTPVQVVATGPITLSGSQIIDGITVHTNDRVLAIAQPDESPPNSLGQAVSNGIWVVQDSGAWTYPADWVLGTQAAEAYVLVLKGTVNGGSSWLCSTPTAIIGGENIGFVEFSLPNQTTAANQGSGAGTLFINKTGNILNFKTIAAGTHMVVTNDATDVSLSTDATSSNIASTIVARDSSTNFSAGTITANLIGSASNNVLKAGDSMSGNLTMLDQAAIDFQDTGSNVVGIQAPTAVTASYTLALPTTAPTANQVLRASPTTPTNLEWITEGSSVPPANSQTIYVTTYGNDTTGDGSFATPYLTLAKAINVANSIALVTPPVAILVGAGTYVENNGSGPLAITSAGISIIGESPIATIITPSTTTNPLLSANQTVLINRMTLQSPTPQQGIGISLTAGSLSNFNSVRFVNFQTGVACSGSTSSYSFISCLFLANGTGLSLNNTTAECSDCTITGALSLAGPPANTGISITGSNTNLVVNSGVCGLCTTGFNISSGAVLTASAVVFKRNSFAVVEASSAQMTLAGCSFEITNSSSDIDIQVNSATAEIIGCEFNGNNLSNTAQATGIQISNGAVVDISAGGIQNFTHGIQIGTGADTSSTVLTASALVIRGCTIDLLQEGSTTLNFNAGTTTTSKISLSNPATASLTYFDIGNNNDLTIGSLANVNTPLLFAAISTIDTPSIDYQSSLYNTQAIGLINPATNASSLFALSTEAVDLTAITTDRTQIAGVRLVSDTHSPVGTTAALRGWDINKNASSAELSFNYQNSDTTGQAAFAEYTVMQLSGVANQLQLPTIGTQIVFGGDTNLFRTSADVLATTSNFIVAPLTPGRVVITDPVTNELSSSVTTSTELSYLSGTTSSVQTQINSKVAKAGDTMTGTLQLPAGTTSLPSLTFTGSPGVGLSASSGNLALSTNATPRLTISSGGTIAIPQFTVPGVLHIVDSSGDVANSLIVDADISATAAISDSKLATITTAGKVANSATTATSTNTPSAIVARDTSGNFSAGTITAALIGTVTGGASLDLPLTGGTLTGALVLPAGTAALPSLRFTGGTNITGISSPVANTLSFDINGAEQMNISATGAVTIDQSLAVNGSLTLGSPLTVANGGTGDTSLTPYAVLTGGTTTTGAVQSIASVGTSGQILTSNGASALPTFQSPAASSISITGNSGGPLVGNAFTFTGGSTGLTFSGAGTTETLTGTLVVANGGTGATTLPAHGVLIGEGTSPVNVTAAGTAGQVFLGTGATTDPIWVTPTAGTGLTITDTASALSYALTVPVTVANGGTGATTLTGVLIGNGTSAVTGNPITQFDVLIGGASNAITSVAPSATAGVPLISGGSAANPSFGTAVVAGGGTGATTLTGVLIGNGTSAVTGNPITQFDVLIGGASNAITSVAPSATAGVPLISGGSAANPSFGTAVVAGGGTGATTLTAHGVLLGEGTSPIVATAAGTNGQVLIGATSADPAFATLTSGSGTIAFTPGVNTLSLDVVGGAAIDAIHGNSGSVSGSTVTITTGASNIQGTALFTGSGSTLTQTFTSASGNNTGLGLSALASVTGTDNTAFGSGAGKSITSGTDHTLIGFNAGTAMTTSTGTQNTALGFGSLDALTTGSYNVGLGALAGSSYLTTESSNICIGANTTGTATESNVLRIGSGTGASAGNLANAYISGIQGVNIGSVANVVTVGGTNANQLGSATITAGTGVTVTPSANTITIASSLGLPVTVASGGTGDTTLTAHGVLIGEGTSPVNVTAAGTAGQVFLGTGATTDPIWVTPTAGTGLTITDTASALSYALTVPVTVANGGTGATTLTGVLIGNGTSAVTGNPITQFDVLIGGASNAITSVAPSATAGVPLISGGSAANPSFGTAVVAGGGTGATTLTGVLIGNGTSAVTGNPITQFDVLIGGASNAITSVAPSATAGVPLISGGSAANPSFGTAVVAGGGTGATTLTAHGVLLGEGTSPIVATAAGTNGQVLIGATSADPAFATLTSGSGTIAFTPGVNTLSLDVVGGAAIDAIHGNSGSVSGSTVTITTGASNIQGTALFTGSGSTLTQTFTSASGNNTGLGLSALASVTGTDNTAFGSGAGKSITSGTDHTLIGFNAGTAMTTSTGTQNTALGFGSLDALTTGSYNVGLGALAGSSYLTTESSNICIGANTTGTATESNVLRIGSGTGASAGNLANAYISGIQGVNIGSVANVVTVGGTNANQLGSATITAGTGVTVTPSANTITIASSLGLPVTVASGGTGDTTLTAHGVLIGEGTSPVNVTAAGTAGQVFLGTGASSDPIWVTPTAGTGLTITDTASALSYALTVPVTVANGGTGATTLTGVLIGNGTSAVTGNPITQFDVLVGGASNAITSVAPSATAGVPLISGGSAANPSFGTAVVAGGGTGTTTLTAHGVLLGEGTSPIVATAVGTNGQVLIGASSADPAFATLTSSLGSITFTPGANSLNLDVTGGVAINTIDGNSGAASGSTVTITTGAGNTQGTALFTGSGSTLTQTFTSATGNNTGLGLNALTTVTGTNNTAFGSGAGKALTSGTDHTLIGFNAGTAMTTSTGTQNTALGFESLSALFTGSYNTCLGANAGSGYTTSESSNICIGDNTAGITGESHVLRIGSGTGTSVGNLSNAYISGINGTNVGSVASIVAINGDHLGSATITAGTGVTVVPTANTITISSSLGLPVTVASGGTGDTTLTAHGVLIGEGTSPVNVTAAGTAGQVLLGTGASSDPIWVTPTAGTGLTITDTASALSYALTVPVTVANGGTGDTTLPIHSLLIGEGTGAIANTGTGTAGQIIVSGGSSADPAWVTPTAGTGLTVTENATTLSYALTVPVTVANGGTGDTTLTANGVLLGNGTSAITATAVGTTGQVLTGVTGSAPTFQAPAASSISITGNSGGALVGNAFTFTGGSTGLTFSGAGSTETLTGTLVVANGGTGATTLTTHGVLLGEGTGAVSATAAGTAGQVLLGTSAITDPIWVTPTAGTGLTITDTASALSYALTVPVTVANGGTGDTTLPAFSVLLGNGTGAIATTTTGTAGQVLLSGGSAANPGYVTPTAGANLSVTTNATTLSYALATPLSLPGGTIGVPEIQFSNGTHTGISSPVANTLSFDILGAEAMNITSSTVTVDGALTVTGDINIPTSAATVGNIVQNGFILLSTYGFNNIFLGQNVGNIPTVTGAQNVGIGTNALIGLTSGSQNVALGAGASQGTVAGSNNTAIGFETLHGSDSSGNTAVGYQALLNTSGSNNTGVGISTLLNLTTGINNAALGINAGFSITTGSNNISIRNAGVAAESNAIRIGDGTHTSNYQAGIVGGIAVANPTTTSVLSIDSAGQLNTGRIYNNIDIQTTGSSSTTGVITKSGSRWLYDANTSNIFLGLLAGNFTTTGSSNVVLGASALQGVTTGSDNVMVGPNTGGTITTGNNNIGMGNNALGSTLTTGSSNIAIGASAGSSLSAAAASNIYIANVGAAESNTIRIGSATAGTGLGQQNKAFITGIRGITTANTNAIAVLVDSAGQLGTVSSSRRFKENIKPISEKIANAFIKLNPVRFTYKADETHTTQYGFIAEEVEEVMPELVTYDEDGNVQSVAYHLLYALLHNQIKIMAEEIASLKASVAALQIPSSTTG